MVRDPPRLLPPRVSKRVLLLRRLHLLRRLRRLVLLLGMLVVLSNLRHLLLLVVLIPLEVHLVVSSKKVFANGSHIPHLPE